MNRTAQKYEVFMRLAADMAELSTCPKHKVGAVLMKNKRIISTGYNGSAIGEPHCGDVGCDLDERNHCVRTVHAEVNALLSAARVGVPTEGATMLCTLEPCHLCMKAMVNAGIESVLYLKPHPDKRNAPFVDIMFKLEV